MRIFKPPFLFLTGKIKRLFRSAFMQRFKLRYPKLYAFVRHRFVPGNFWGLPLTILLVLVLVNLALLSELAEQVVNSRQVQQLDLEVTAWFFNLRTPFLSKVVYYFTQIGSVQGVTLSTTLLGLYLLVKKRGFYLFALLVSVIGSGLFMRITKLYFQRARPLELAYYAPEASYSFPSGHATSAMALTGIICYFIFLEIKSNRIRLPLWFAGALYVLLMGLSRIYLGVHFLTDILAGYLLGSLWVVVAIGLMEYSALKKRQQQGR